MADGQVLASTQPQLRNRNQIGPALVRQYPAELATQGIGGTPVHRILIDENGNVRQAVLVRSSGHPALDSGARTVTLQMKFTPATYNDCRLPYVTEMPVVFEAR